MLLTLHAQPKEPAPSPAATVAQATPQADVELVQACTAGDRKAQELFYRRFSGKMFSVCLRYVADRDAATDVLQDAFIKAFRNLHLFKCEGSLEGWLRRIVVRTALDAYRKSSRLTIVDLDEAPPVQDYAPSALSTMSASELMGMVQALSPGYRTVFNLYAVEGYTHKEIGELLGISEGTSKSQYARARVQLQNSIKRASRTAQPLLMAI